MTFADAALNYVDLDGPWGNYRLFVGGEDVTNFRNVPAQIGSYQLVEPYSYGPADFTIPALTQFEVDAWGTGELAWMGNGKPVTLKQVDAAGHVVRVVWRGFISIAQVTPTGVALHCDGEVSGRLSYRQKLPDLFALKRHVGRKIFDAFLDIGQTLTPYRGADIGVLTDGRGMSGTYLDYVNSLLAATINTDGSQYTILARDGGDYHLAPKVTDVTDFTVFLGAHGVVVDLTDDLSERPNTIYGQGISPEGLVWVNGKYPGLKQGETPDYPMTDDSPFGEGAEDADTDSGSGVTAMIRRLVSTGYLDGRRALRHGFNDDVTEAIKDLQDDAGLTQSGNMNPATWDALYDLSVSGLSLRDAFVAPLAQSTEVRRWNRTSSGAIAARNPNFDPKVVQVDLAVDHGTSVEKSRARRYSRGVLHRAQDVKNWAGTITLTSDVFAGVHLHNGADPVPMSRLDIKPGMGVELRGFDDNTRLHVSVVNVNADLSVTLGVDTQCRDAATLSEVIARNIESRSHPARQWLQQRRTDANTRFIEFSEVGGQIFDTVTCPGNEWTVFPVIAGQAGSVSRVRLHTSDAEAAYSLAITAVKTGPGFWHKAVGNPLRGAAVADLSVHDGGTGYTSATVTISGGGGSGATATATVSAGGGVESVTLTSPGGGYGAPPTVTISGDGTGAKASASLEPLDEVWSTPKITRLVDDQRALLGAWGSAAQPCGYWPRSYTGDDGRATGAPVTGLFMDDGGFDYHTFSQPVLWVAIYPDRDTTIEPQRILWETLEALN